MREYWKLVADRAFRETCAMFGLDSLGRLAVGIAVPSLTVALLWSVGSNDDAAGSFWARVAATVAIILVFPVAYAFHFVRAPVRLHEEQKTRLAVLDAKKAKQEVIDDLARLHAIGQGNFLGRVTSEGDLERWVTAVDEWAKMVSDRLAEKVSDSRQISFDNALPALALSWQHKYNESHDQMLGRLRAKLDRLQVILDEMQRTTT